MRLRNIPGSRETIAASPWCIREDTLQERKGHWSEIFGNDHPIAIEIGMGKGRFITDMALAHPDINYIGIEKYSSVLLRALEKREVLAAEGKDPANLFYIRMDAEIIADIFDPGEVGTIYLNFSDPWPKDRHAHRRLPGTQFLARYEKILAPDGHLEFKTDNDGLFSFALESAEKAGWITDAVTWDLHHDAALCEGNIMTEYEARFSAAGNQIHKMISHPSRG